MGQLMFANKSFGLLKELAIDSEFITNPSMKSNVQKMITSDHAENSKKRKKHETSKYQVG